ncbi:MAG: hypothetical protein L3J37_10480 [Rhodobacteraceae bacterium]|nr:hypothetical protein [Paracoccaceae bacterium]
MTFKRFYHFVIGITVINYAMMLFYTTPILRAESGGLWPLGIRITGYDLADALAYNAALSDEGRQLYVTTQAMLDTLFPALLALTLMLTIYQLAPKLPALFLTPLAGALFYYYENAAINQILVGTGPDAGLVEMASLLTTLKFASIALSLMIILWLWRKGKARG